MDLSKSKIYSIFPIAIVEHYFERKFSKEELYWVEKNQTDLIRNYNNYYSKNYHVLEHSSMKSIKKFVEEGLQSYIDNIICPKENLRIYVTQSWFNYTSCNDSHHTHMHPNSIVSGVLYIKTGNENDSIVFERSDSQFILDFKSTKFNCFNERQNSLPVSEGKMVLFPSTLLHYVPKFSGENCRISLAFNSFVKGNIGNFESLTGVYL
jgi:uncharacterized protein (TIGR02466 family)